VSPRDLSLSALFAALTAAGALVAVPLPFSPVPVTLQTLFTYLAVLLLGGRLAALSQLVYVLLGCAGLPVFAGMRGRIGVLLGPTGGYLLGFVVGALAGGIVAEAGPPSRKRRLLSSVLATAVIYALGALWLAVTAGLDLLHAVLVGVVPFVPGDAAKALIAVEVAERVCRATRWLPGCASREARWPARE